MNANLQEMRKENMLFLCNFIHLKKRYEYIYGGIELFWDLNEISVGIPHLFS